MLFRRLVFIAFAMAIVLGAAFGVIEQFTTIPVILHAEQYEHPEITDAHQASTTPHAEHVHEHTWEPSNGFERTIFTMIADMAVVFGFSLLLMVFMSAAERVRGTPVGPGRGALWGLAAFVAVFLAPAFGLPPETPGILAAPLADRQLWWLATVVIAVMSLGLLVFAHGWWKLIAFALIPLPYLVGAPEIRVPDSPVIALRKSLHSGTSGSNSFGPPVSPTSCCGLCWARLVGGHSSAGYPARSLAAVRKLWFQTDAPC